HRTGRATPRHAVKTRRDRRRLTEKSGRFGSHGTSVGAVVTGDPSPPEPFLVPPRRVRRPRVRVFSLCLARGIVDEAVVELAPAPLTPPPVRSDRSTPPHAASHRPAGRPRRLGVGDCLTPVVRLSVEQRPCRRNIT